MNLFPFSDRLNQILAKVIKEVSPENYNELTEAINDYGVHEYTDGYDAGFDSADDGEFDFLDEDDEEEIF